ncbi:F-box domain protein [Kalmanozyma brasiliensis GHG001]|nr:F-box domain protein [Kalmanozyma brasiliensis GHG001]EST05970.2 F-box domain protein [Kalmanozyma brasiliensis GHG001]
MDRGWLNEQQQPTASNSSRTVIEQLPHEILLDIFAHLDAASLARLAATSSRIRLIALQDILWRPFILHAIHSISPPVSGPSIHPLESSLPLWHPDFGLQADVIHPPAWPTADEYLQQSSSDQAAQLEAELSLFQDAPSLYQVYVLFVRKVEPLLGWWASDVPFYGMVVRIVLDLHYSQDPDDPSSAPAASTSRSPAPTQSSPDGGKRSSPAVVCQRVYPINRLQGLDSDMGRWSEVTGFPMPSNSAVIGQGTILRRSLTQIRTDLCEPGIRTENLWHYSWDDARHGTPVPSEIASVSSRSMVPNGGSLPKGDNDVRAQISSQSWLRSLDPQDGPARPLRLRRGGIPVEEGDDEDLDDLEDEAEEIDRVLRRAAEAPAFFNFGFDLEEDDPAQNQLRQLMVGPHRHAVGNIHHTIYPLSGAVTTRSNDADEDGGVQVSPHAWQPYLHANERNAGFSQHTSIMMPSPPVIFPPPALLPAIRLPPWSRLDKVQIGMSNIWEAMSAERRWLIEGERLTVDSLLMTPPPPYRPWPIQAHTLESEPRFFPIRNPRRLSALRMPSLVQQSLPLETAVPASLSSFAAEAGGASTSRAPADPILYRHTAPPPQHDPAHVEFDWDAVEGLYSMTYGPHGIELLYIRARELTSLDFAPDDRLPAWPAEPLLSSDDMYEQTRISRRSAARIGARVLEAVKVLGDPNIPRGQITWRAFIDDPGRSAVPWRPPPDGFRRHTPWPLRPPHAISSQDERSPGLVLPAHGRVAGEGFVGPGWATALACISSIDEIQIWWQPMYKISIAKKLTGV